MLTWVHTSLCVYKKERETERDRKYFLVGMVKTVWIAYTAQVISTLNLF